MEKYLVIVQADDVESIFKGIVASSATEASREAIELQLEVGQYQSIVVTYCAKMAS